MQKNKKRPFSIFSIIFLFIGFRYLVDTSLFGNSTWLNFIPILLLFGVVPLFRSGIMNRTNNTDETNDYTTTETDYKSSYKAKKVCDYCGNTIDSDIEYCDKCGAAQLPD